jgi:quinohemoprotein ethanol dehydrogenase
MRARTADLSLALSLISIVVAGCQRDKPAAVTTELPQAEPAQPETRTAWVNAERLANADAEPGNWLAHGRSSSEQRFSPLEQISDANVAELGLAWYVDLDTTRGQEATPIVVDGVLYSTSAWSKVQAVDAKTGRMLWQYDPEVPGIWDVRACCGVQNRGAAVWKGNVYSATLDGRLIALDAESGELQWEINTTDQAQSYTVTGAPRMAGDRIIIGNGGAEYGVRGYVSAYDPETAELLWRFYTVPGNPADGFEDETQEMAAKTWSGEWWTNGGGGTAWDSFAYDAELDLVYIGTGNGSPWARSIRSPDGGDNLFLASIVAVHAATGEYAWHYQTTPGDTWDYTAVQHMVLADIEIEGADRKVIMQAPKNGFFYVIDRATGELISAENIVPTNWATHIDMETGRPIETADARYDETLAAKVIAPGPGGAHNWQPMTYSPDTGLVYIPAKQSPFTYQLNENFKPGPIGFNHGVNTWDTPEEVIPLGPEFGEEFQGFLLAWNPVTQEEVWRVPHNNFENGGLLSTAGNLVFQGNADELMVAYNATTGEKLWEAPTQTGVLAPPVSYTIDGEQYIAVVAGWGAVSALTSGALLNPEGVKRNVSRILAFKLGANGELPDLPPLPALPLPPNDFGSETQIQSGDRLYRRYCLICHGAGVIGGGSGVPDLRHSPMIGSTEVFNSVVLDGVLQDFGMVSFAEVIGEDDAEAIRAFVIHRSNEQRK